MTGAERAEKRGLWLSIIGALFMAALGIGFAIGLVSRRVAMLGRAPDEALQHRAREAVAAAFDDSMEFDTTLRMQQIGRFTYLQLYVVCREGQAVDVDRLDACRSAVHDALRGHFENLALDVIFTHDPRWVAVAVGRDVISSGHETRGGSRR